MMTENTIVSANSGEAFLNSGFWGFFENIMWFEEFTSSRQS